MYLPTLLSENFVQKPKLPIREYQKITRGILNKLRPKFGGLINIAHTDEDLFNECVHAVMTADSSYNEIEESVSNEIGWRFQSVTWQLQNYLTKANRFKNKPTVSINVRCNHEELGTLLESSKNYLKQVDDKDEINQLLSYTKPRVAYFIKKHYLEGYTMHELACTEGITRAAMSDLIGRGLEEIRTKTANLAKLKDFWKKFGDLCS